MKRLILAGLLSVAALNAEAAPVLEDCWSAAPGNKYVQGSCPTQVLDGSLGTPTTNGVQVTGLGDCSDLKVIVHNQSTVYTNADRFDFLDLPVRTEPLVNGALTVDWLAPGAEDNVISAVCYDKSIESNVWSSAPFDVVNGLILRPVCSEEDIVAATTGSPLQTEGVSDITFFDVPSLTAEQNTLQRRTGILDIRDYNIPRDGSDQSVALQAVFDDAHEYELSLYLGEGADGNMGFNRQIYFTKVQNNQCGNSVRRDNAIRAFGNPLDKPVFELVGTQTGVDFDDPNNPRAAIFMFGQRSAQEDCAKGFVYNINGVNRREQANNNFISRISDFVIDTGNTPNISGLIALDTASAQYAMIDGIEVIIQNAFAAFSDIPGRLGGAWELDVTATNTRYGLWTNGTNATSIFDSVFRGGFTEAVFASNERTGTVLHGVEVELDLTEAPMIGLYDFAIFAGGSSAYSILDLKFTATNGSGTDPNAHAVIENRLDERGRTIVMQNAHFLNVGVGKALAQADDETTVFTAANQSVAEYVYTDKNSLSSVASQITDIGNARYRYKYYEVTAMVDGVQSKNTILDMGTDPAPADIRAAARFEQDGIDKFSPYASRSINSLLNLCITNKGNKDVTDELNEAMATYGSQYDIWLSKGAYLVRPGDLVIPPNTRLYGLNPSNTRIVQIKDSADTPGEFLVNTVDDANSHSRLDGIQTYVQTGIGVNQVGHTHWRQGAKSRIGHVPGYNYPVTKDQTLADVVWHRFSGSAGGIYRTFGLQRADSSGTGAIPFLIEGTSQPMTFQGMNPEHHRTDLGHWNVTNSSNVRYVGNKMECKKRFYTIDSSTNIAAYGHGHACHMALNETEANITVTGDSDDIYMAMLLPDSWRGADPNNVDVSGVPANQQEDHILLNLDWDESAPHFREEYGGQVFDIPNPVGVSVMKRGDFDHSAFVHQ